MQEASCRVRALLLLSSHVSTGWRAVRQVKRHAAVPTARVKNPKGDGMLSTSIVDVSLVWRSKAVRRGTVRLPLQTEQC